MKQRAKSAREDLRANPNRDLITGLINCCGHEKLDTHADPFRVRKNVGQE